METRMPNSLGILVFLLTISVKLLALWNSFTHTHTHDENNYLVVSYTFSYRIVQSTLGNFRLYGQLQI